MRAIPDWVIQLCWWISGIFATGAVWYFLSTKNYWASGGSATGALVFAASAVLLHRSKDRAERDTNRIREEERLSSAPTKENVERMIMESNAGTDWNRQISMERSVYSYVRDINLRFEMLNDERGIQCDDFREPWANRFPDKSATGYWCDLWYGSTHLARYILVAVDGARAILPIPKRGDPGQRPTRVLPLEYKIAKIHDFLGTLDTYMKRAGLTVDRAA